MFILYLQRLENAKHPTLSVNWKKCCPFIFITFISWNFVVQNLTKLWKQEFLYTKMSEMNSFVKLLAIFYDFSSAEWSRDNCWTISIVQIHTLKVLENSKPSRESLHSQIMQRQINSTMPSALVSNQDARNSEGKFWSDKEVSLRRLISRQSEAPFRRHTKYGPDLNRSFCQRYTL